MPGEYAVGESVEAAETASHRRLEHGGRSGDSRRAIEQHYGLGPTSQATKLREAHAREHGTRRRQPNAFDRAGRLVSSRTHDIARRERNFTELEALGWQSVECRLGSGGADPLRAERARRVVP